MSAKPSSGATFEVTWFKSSYSSNDGPDCVEIAVAPDAVRVRDSKVVPGPQLGFTATAWADFVMYASED